MRAIFGRITPFLKKSVNGCGQSKKRGGPIRLLTPAEQGAYARELFPSHSDFRRDFEMNALIKETEG